MACMPPFLIPLCSPALMNTNPLYKHYENDRQITYKHYIYRDIASVCESGIMIKRVSVSNDNPIQAQKGRRARGAA